MTFSFFLSIYSRCGAPASWAARHTIVCLDTLMIEEYIMSLLRICHLNTYLKFIKMNEIKSDPKKSW